jgi:hypothetical protein
MKKMKPLILIIGGLAVYICLLNATIFHPEKPYVILGKEKYYQCETRIENNLDTMFEPGGFTIFKTQTKIIFYDHFKCEYLEQDKKCKCCGKRQ